MGAERREQPRVTTSIPVRLTFEGVAAFVNAYTEDISLGGVFVATRAAVPLGTPVTLTIEVAPGKGFVVKAEVAWRREASNDKPAGVGLRFTEVSPQHRQFLEQEVQKHLAAQGLHPEADRAALVHHGPAPEPEHATVDVGSIGLDDSEGPVLGIDLGTCHCCACVFDQGHTFIVEFTDDTRGVVRTVPSVVAFDDEGKSTVGYLAAQRAEDNVTRTIFGSKRFVGRHWAHPDVQKILSRFPYRVIPDAQQRVAVEINGLAISLTAVSAKILEYIKIKAQKTLRRPISRAIITVPASYNQNQRDAVVQAGRLAGLTVERIVNEPTAAAIAYGLTQATPRQILVYDLGGGTFDVAVMSVSATALRVLATAGDVFLGGEDFDGQIVDHVRAAFLAKTGKALSQNHRAQAPLKAAAEKAKCRLSLHPETMVTVRKALLADGSESRVEIALTRAKVERLVAPLVDRTLAICDLALGDAGVAKNDLAEILLVGGQTQMPYVRERVAAHFGREPRCDIRPDEAVALGAGMLAELRSRNTALTLHDTLPASIGIDAGNGVLEKLLVRNTPLPHRVSRGVVVPAAKLEQFALDLYQGDGTLFEAEYLGQVRAAGIEPGSFDPVRLGVELSLSADGLLRVRVKHLDTGQEQDVLLHIRASNP
jgi:molecular chaperone DnaK